MLLNEIFDTCNTVTWKSGPKGFLGTFYIDDEPYQINIDEYEINLSSGKKIVFDVGFQKNDSSELTGDFKSARVVGCIINGLVTKINILNPDIVMFGALNAYGSVDKRVKIYSYAFSWVIKRTNFTYISPWFEIKIGKYCYAASQTISPADNSEIEKFIENVLAAK